MATPTASSNALWPARAVGLVLTLVSLACGCGRTEDPTIAHWRFDGPVEAGLTDLAGDHDGVARGALRSTTAAWSFPGDTSCVQVSQDSTLDLVAGLSIEAIVQPTRLGNPANGEGYQAIVEKHDSAGGYLLVIKPSGKLEYWLETDDGRMVDSSTVAIEPGSGWHHVAMTWNGATVGFYIDHVPAGERPFDGTLRRCPQDLFLVNDDNVWWGYGGDMREMRISNVALPPEAFLPLEK